MNHKLGISEKTWTYIGVASGTLLLISSLRTAANVIGSDGVFGYGKSQKLATYGKGKEKTWSSIQALSLGLVALTMVENSHDNLVKLAEVREQGKEVIQFW
jgi:hypothetical protein|tara:strand:+ start:112 stop:414 length:303 start_codon:yes stop_codon:yes gene_type:complete